MISNTFCQRNLIKNLRSFARSSKANKLIYTSPTKISTFSAIALLALKTPQIHAIFTIGVSNVFALVAFIQN